MAKKQSGPQTHYVCQLYEERKVGRAGKSLAVKNTLIYPNAAQAEDRAERAYSAGQCAGADAYRIIVDPDTGDTSEPVFLARLGKVPEVDPV